MRFASIPSLTVKVTTAFLISFVSIASAPAASKKAPVAPSTADAGSVDRVWIKINDGSIACDDPKMARTLEKSRALLDAEQVKVFESKSANDGKMRAAVCGIPKGNEHHFLISKKDLPRAEAKGFQLDPEGASPAAGATNR